MKLFINALDIVAFGVILLLCLKMAPLTTGYQIKCSAIAKTCELSVGSQEPPAKEAPPKKKQQLRKKTPTPTASAAVTAPTICQK